MSWDLWKRHESAREVRFVWYDGLCGIRPSVRHAAVKEFVSRSSSAVQTSLSVVWNINLEREQHLSAKRRNRRATCSPRRRWRGTFALASSPWPSSSSSSRVMCVSSASHLISEGLTVESVRLEMHAYNEAKMIRTLVFSAAKNGFKSVISIFCCSVSVGNISLHFQTFILPLIVIIQWDFCAPHRDLIWSSSVCLEWHEETEQTETD